MWNPQKAGYLLRNILGSKVVKTNLKGLPYQLFCYQVSAADKGYRIYPFNPRPDAVALYSGCTLDNVPATSYSLCTSAASSLSNKALALSKVSMFTPLPVETCHVVETNTTISYTIHSAPQAAKQTSKNRRKNRPKRIIFKIEIQLTHHKLQKSTPLQDSSGENMIAYDDEEEVESRKKKIR
ncbi:hypothetical protein TNCV_3436211 [Trichonephila clavipes]|nr:hypothetical protein TNCV_3436211 [Trichonephila clavipes]